MKGLIYGVVYILVIVYIFGFLVNKISGFDFSSPNVKEAVYLSKNGGESWSKIETKNLLLNSKKVDFGGENYSRLYLASIEGMFQIDNKQEQSKAPTKTPNSLGVIKYIQNSHNSNIIYLIVKEGQNQKILISYNAGQNFKPVLILNKNDEFSAFEIDPIVYSTIYVGTKNGSFLISTDYGETWQKKQDFSPRAVYSIGVRKTDGAIFLGITQKPFNVSYFINPPLAPDYPEILFSTNSGNTFLNIKDAFSANSIEKKFIPKKIVSDNVGKIYFVSKNKIYFTNHNEILPFNIILPSETAEITDFTIDPQNPNIIYLISGNIIYKTNNGGITWQTLEPPNQKKIKEIKINPKDSNIILLSTVS